MSNDAAGNVTKTTDALNSVTEYTYDSLNRLKKTVSDKGKDTQATTSYAYDAFGRIIQAVDAENGKTKATYDNVGNILSITDPNGGISRYKYDSMNRMTEKENAVGGKNTYTYNARGLLAESKNARNQSTTYTYDKLGRITSATDSLGTISYTYDANGNVLTVTDENGTITREYDCMDRVTKYTDFRGNVVKYGYDTLGNLVTLEYAGGRIARYSYYPTGRLKNVVDWNNRTTNYEYDGNGRLTKLIRPDGSIETYRYDALGQLIEQTDINGSKVINSFTYTYDTAGHIIKTESQNVAEETVSVSSAAMQYDAANRLIKYNGEDVEYDADGNMTYGPLDGVMTHFAYDCRNRLVSAGNTTYEYDAENNRIAVVVNNVRTDYVVENNASVYSQLTNGELTYAPSVKGEERELYFLTDVGTIKGGHHLEDKNRCVLYEAKMTKFSPLSAFAFDFIDHENNKTTKHLVGHAEEMDWNSILIDNNYAFTIDGQDVWKHLRAVGVTIDSRFGQAQGVMPSYTIRKDGEELAYAETTSQYAHEEDAEAHKVADKVPVQGFYRVHTREKSLDLLFLILVAMARSGATDERGGSRRMLFNTITDK